jgi:hypothetical protein
MIYIFFKIKYWIDHHRDFLDLAIGGSIGAGTGINHYWDHFLQDENLFKLYDGIVNTAIHTIIGAVLLWLIHKILKKK